MRKSKINKNRKRRGYTLIELLVVLAVIITVGGVIVTLVSLSLQGSQKTEAMTVVKQNGTFALNQMVKQIRFARALTCNVPSSIVITSNEDGGITTYTCPSSPANGIASNGATLINTSAVVVSNCSFACTQTNADISPQVTIQFTLSTRSTSNLFETKASLPFKSSVLLRNIPGER